MEEKHVHIITHDVPYPADFGGVVDLYNKIVALNDLGIKIHLHCFLNKRPKKDELIPLCQSIHYYKRTTGISGISFRLPYIVSSRISAELVDNLRKDNYPILIEGIHCSFLLNNNQFSNRSILLRLHNVEFEYYKHLAKQERNFFKKIYFTIESFLLKKYENSIAQKVPIAAVSEQDVVLYKKHFKPINIFYLPVFIPHTTVNGKVGNGCYCLYHGNLSVIENEKAATWLLQNVFNDLLVPFVIAGKNPSKQLEKLAHKHPHTCIVANPSDSEMQDMIAKAQLNILPSFNNTGIKLKLLNALYNGRYCLVNQAGVEGSGLDELCTIASTVSDFKNKIAELYSTPFDENEKEKRTQLLHSIFNNKKSASILIDTLWK